MFHVCTLEYGSDCLLFGRFERLKGATFATQLQTTPKIACCAKVSVGLCIDGTTFHYYVLGIAD